MKKILVGFIFIFFNFSINFNQNKIGLIPNFIGFILIVKGLDELLKFSGYFEKSRNYSKIMVPYALITYLMDIFNPFGNLEFISTILGLVSTVFSLLIAFNIIRGIEDIEDEEKVYLNSTSLHSSFNVLLVGNILTYTVMFFLPAFLILSLIISLAGGIYYLISFYKTITLYNSRH